MYKKLDFLFSIIIKLFAFISMLSLLLILIFIIKESLPLFDKISISSFLLNNEWDPTGKTSELSIKIFVFATLYVSFLALLIALPIGTATAAVIAVLVPDKWKGFFKTPIKILAGIPSVIYGFIGLSIIVKFFERYFNFSTGESVLSAGILLAIMILPYIVTNCEESMAKAYNKYSAQSLSLGINKMYMLNNLILPCCKKAILASSVLALARAMGETMAVMMVIGNSPIFPKLLGKSETIPSLIALEMGSAKIGSLHYHSLFASGLILLIILLIINAIFYSLKRKFKI